MTIKGIITTSLLVLLQVRFNLIAMEINFIYGCDMKPGCGMAAKLTKSNAPK